MKEETCSQHVFPRFGSLNIEFSAQVDTYVHNLLWLDSSFRSNLSPPQRIQTNGKYRYKETFWYNPRF